jgi:sulfur carrier protein
MRLSVNGAPRDAPDCATVAEIVAGLAPARTRGIAVAVNGTVVPRTRWPATVLRGGDAVEILTAVQGG